MQPSIWYYWDVVIGRDGLEHWDSDGDIVLIFCIPLTQDKCIIEEDDLAIDVLMRMKNILAPP